MFFNKSKRLIVLLTVITLMLTWVSSVYAYTWGNSSIVPTNVGQYYYDVYYSATTNTNEPEGSYDYSYMYSQVYFNSVLRETNYTSDITPPVFPINHSGASNNHGINAKGTWEIYTNHNAELNGTIVWGNNSYDSFYWNGMY